MKSNKDRIITVSSVSYSKVQIKDKNKYKDSYYSKSVAQGNHIFYYQPANSVKRFFLFATRRYYPSIAEVFVERGVLLNSNQTMRTHSITLDEFYRLKRCHHNYVLNKIYERIPVWIDYIIRYELSPANCNAVRSTYNRCHDNECVA